MTNKFPYEVGARVKLVSAPKGSTAEKMIGQCGTVDKIAPLQPYLADVAFDFPEYERQLIVCDGEMLESAESAPDPKVEEIREMLQTIASLDTDARDYTFRLYESSTYLLSKLDGKEQR